jgi:hypothetical protein
MAQPVSQPAVYASGLNLPAELRRAVNNMDRRDACLRPEGKVSFSFIKYGP